MKILSMLCLILFISACGEKLKFTNSGVESFVKANQAVVNCFPGSGLPIITQGTVNNLESNCGSDTDIAKLKDYGSCLATVCGSSGQTTRLGTCSLDLSVSGLSGSCSGALNS